MQEINIGHIISWLLLGGLFVGFLTWKLSTDSRTKKRAAILRNTAEPRAVTVLKVERSRYGIAAIIFEYQDANGEQKQERFVPKTFTAEVDTMAIEEGENGKLYVKSFSNGSVAWLDLKQFSSCGQVGHPFG